MSEWKKLGFDSRFEWEVYEDSDKVRTTHHDTVLPFTVERKYNPDFRIVTRTKKIVHIETKGYFTSADRSKTRLVIAQNPGIDLRLVFMNAHNRLNRKSKTTYAQWCDKYNIKWAEKRIPKEWYNE